MYQKIGMFWFRFVFLAFALMATSAYTFRCKWMCTDQTNIQEDYVAQHDQCIELAQMKVGTSSTPLDDSARKSKLAEYFSECMKQNGWEVPSDKDKAKDKPAAAAPASLPAPTPAPPSKEEKASLMRSSECAFARANADVSSLSALRAKACDLECVQALKAAPEAPRPAACPPASDEDMSEGFDKEGK